MVTLKIIQQIYKSLFITLILSKKGQELITSFAG